MREQLHFADTKSQRPVTIGEYPYYRAAPEAWLGNLAAMKDCGIDVVSFYIPWRFHEVWTEVGARFDFSGIGSAQRNVIGLLEHLARLGLGAIVKPGPFIHAEVQLGGLPDRMCSSQFSSYVDLRGERLRSQGQGLPSFFDPTARAQMAAWLSAVDQSIVRPYSEPGGPIVGVQIGNEGIYGDAGLPLERSDASQYAEAAFVAWLEKSELSAEQWPDVREVAHWSPANWQAWGKWVGVSLIENWDWISSFFPKAILKTVNVPLVQLDTPTSAFGAWLVRQEAARRTSYWRGHTEWIGDASSDKRIFLAHIIGIQLGNSHIAEANWGFTWTQKRFAEPGVPLFHSLLGLILGSRSCSVYTACATETWGADIDLDAKGLKSDGFEPELFGPPYCPGAPLHENGARNPNADSLSRLTKFVQLFGEELAATTLVCAEDRLIATERIHRFSGSRDPVLDDLFREVETRLFDRGELLGLRIADPAKDNSCEKPNAYRGSSSNIPRLRSKGGLTAVVQRRSDDARRIFCGIFNPSDGADQVHITTSVGERELIMRAGAAAIIYFVDGREIAMLSTDEQHGTFSPVPNDNAPELT